jgi:anti-sigma factor RsiW
MTDATREQQTLLLNAVLDGELDAAGTLDMEARLAADPELAAEYRRLVGLRDVIQARLPRDGAPDALRARVMAMAQPPISARSTAQPPIAARPTAPRRPKFWDASYRALAASLLVGMLLGGGVVQQLASTARVDDVDRDVVAGFVRGRLSGQPVDVVTSDRHTVKPWLAGKIAGATTVVDLKADGFPLVGGRVDVVGQTPVATLIYQRREHQIALSEMPLGSAGGSGASDRRTRDGFSLLEWSDGGRRFTAVSDLPPGELDTFGAAFRRAAAAEREEPPKP